jgi:hypothetical protein
MLRRLVPVGILVATALSLTACVVVPAQPYGDGGYAQQPYYEPVVPVAPPPPRVEYVGPPPVVGYLWIGGYWGWHDGRHDWVPGHWEAPRPGYRWVPHEWVHEGNGWRLHGGHWDHDRR